MGACAMNTILHAFEPAAPQRSAPLDILTRFTVAIARAHGAGDSGRVDRLLRTKVRVLRRHHGLPADGATWPTTAASGGRR